MKIVIVGPGAMGCLFGAFLTRIGQDVYFLDKNSERAREIERQGILVEGISGSFAVKDIKATTATKNIGKADLILISTKSYDTDNAVKKAVPSVGKDSLVLTLQNGLGNIEAINRYVPKAQIIAGITAEGATLLGTARVRHAGKGETVLGVYQATGTKQQATGTKQQAAGSKQQATGSRQQVPGSKQQATSNRQQAPGNRQQAKSLGEIVKIFNEAGFETKTTDDVEGLIWSKLVINVGINALTALTRLNNGRLLEFDGTKAAMELAVKEALSVAAKNKIRLSYPNPLEKVVSVCRATAGNVSSMLQDILRKKPTEIDFINGAIVNEGRKLGMPTPVNSVLTDLVKAIESSYTLQFDRS